MVLEARLLVDQNTNSDATTTTTSATVLVDDDVVVSHMLYNTFERYQSSRPFHAQHDETMLLPRITNTTTTTNRTSTTSSTGTGTENLTSTTENEESVEETKIDSMAVKADGNISEMVQTNVIADTTAVVELVVPDESETAVTVSMMDDQQHNEKSSKNKITTSATMPATSTGSRFHSNVCCVDMDDDNVDNNVNVVDHHSHSVMDHKITNTATTATTSFTPDNTTIKALPKLHEEAEEKDAITNNNMTTVSVEMPDLQSYRNGQFPVIAIMTISDRAYAGIYPDKSGPMIAETIRSLAKHTTNKIPHDLDFVMNLLVPDDMAAIQAKIQTLCQNSGADIDCIITTGGTGFGIRDVTPEATREIIQYELFNCIPHIMTTYQQQQSILTSPLQQNDSGSTSAAKQRRDTIQSLSLLSRGVVGVLPASSSMTSGNSNSNNCSYHHTLIVNLPGSPTAIQELLPILFPYLLHIIIELQHITPEVLHIG
jgi:molybdenum cofactor synthesis domain-containing protein